VDSREEAESLIADIRLKYKDATHNVPAMVIGDKFQIQWTSDDGEPQGTAGAPIMQMLVKEGLTNLAVVVTRYYGGVKLGTGGLVRAYTGSAKLGIEAAGLCLVKDLSILTLKLDYSHLSKIKSVSQNEGFEIQEIIYEDAVKLKIAAEPENLEGVKKIISEISCGKYLVLSLTEGNCCVKI
jgi:uncharacterized YigZ family protein